MSSNQRPHTNVGMGTLREADEDHHTVNEGWSFFQQYLPDNSIVDSEEFSQSLDMLNTSGPYSCTLPAMPDRFLDPSSLRLKGTCKIVYVKNNVKQENLPKKDAYYSPHANAKETYKIKVEQVVADKDTNHGKEPNDLVSIEDAIFPFTVATADKKTSTTDFFKLSIVPDNTKEENATHVVPVNLMPQALWKDIEIKLNSRTVTKNANLEYAHKAYLETLMTYGEDALHTHLQSEMWHPDTPEEISDPNYEKTYDTTKTFEEKNLKYCRDNTFSFNMQIHTEFNSINGFIMDQMPYTFTFVRNEPSFFLRTKENDTTCAVGQFYTIEFTELKLVGKYVKPSAEVMKLYKAHLASEQPFLYQTTRTEILKNQAMKGQSQFDWDRIFPSDHLPDTIYCCMLDMDAKSGAWNKDPFNFKHYDVSSIHLRINNRNIPTEPITMKWKDDDDKNENYMLAYKQLYENCSIKLNNVGLSITPERFKAGSTIFAWDLNHDSCGGAHSNHGNLIGTASIHMLYKKPLPENICIIVAGVNRDYLAINNERFPNVLTSYGIEQYYTNLGLPVPKFKQFL